MNMILEQHIAEEAGEFYSSGRWEYPDSPGSAHVLSIGERTKSPEALAAFRGTKEGQYLLDVIASYEDALNDDWMPFEIAGLPLNKAREFIRAVWEELQQGDAANAVENLRKRYAGLANS